MQIIAEGEESEKTHQKT